jgi:hypothetical protein
MARGYPPQHLGIVRKPNRGVLTSDCQDITGLERPLTKHDLGGFAGHDPIERN